MPFSTISQKTIFPGFNSDQQQIILSAMEIAYNNSILARTMFDSWSGTISINFLRDHFQARRGRGILEIDLAFLENLGYIDNAGKAKPYLLVQALVHEFAHALFGLSDNNNNLTDYQGENVRYVNLIWQELNYEPMLSITSMGPLDRQGWNYSYTKSSPIDAAIRVETDWRPQLDWTSPVGISRDLVLGGSENNDFHSGAGNDFLFGGGGDDTLDGGNGIDTAVYFVNTFDLAFDRSSSVARLAGVNEPSVNSNPTNTQVQIFTIFTGSSGADTAALEAIARDNGGAFLAGLNDNDLLTKLVEIVNNPSINQSPMISIVANDPDATETIDGDTTNPGQFTLNRTGNLSQSLTVAYTLSGTATNGSDYQSLLETVTFAAGDSTATIDLTLLDDRLDEGSEAVTLTLSDGGTQYQLDPTAQFATVTITDNDPKPTIKIANVSQIEGNIGTNNYAFNVTLSNPSVEIVDDRPLMNPLFRAGFKSLSIKSNARQLSTVN